MTETIAINKIKINDRYRKDLGNVFTLAQSIKEIGLLHPVVINENNELIAGHRRIEAFKINGMTEIPVHKINLQDILKGEFHENVERKDFTSREKVAIKQAIEPEFKEEANQRISKGGRKHGLIYKDLANGEESTQVEENLNKSRENVARFVNTSHDTLNKLETIIHASEENPDEFGDLPEKIDAGDVSVNYAHKMVKRSEDHKSGNIPELPTGQFDIILADPPWSYDINTRGSPDDHYQVMTNEQIYNLDVPAADNCMLFLWATAPKLQEALNTVREWGFEYKTNMVWIKDKIGTGHYVRGKHEFLLIAEKGDMPLPQEKTRPNSVFEAPRKQHSEKPEIVYQLIEQMYPNRSYLELFARQNKRPSWVTWGKESQQQ